MKRGWVIATLKRGVLKKPEEVWVPSWFVVWTLKRGALKEPEPVDLVTEMAIRHKIFVELDVPAVHVHWSRRLEEFDAMYSQKQKAN